MPHAVPPLSEWRDETVEAEPAKRWRPPGRSVVYHVAQVALRGRNGFVAYLTDEAGVVGRWMTPRGEKSRRDALEPADLFEDAQEAHEACAHDFRDPTAAVIRAGSAGRRPNPDGGAQAHVQYAKVRGDLPWNERDFLVFHTLTAAGHWPDCRGVLESLVGAGAELLPAATRGARSRVLDADAAAGDDRYLFFSPGRPYRGDESSDRRSKYPSGEVSLAFDYAELADRATFGWRSSDLLWLYNVLLKRHRRRSWAAPKGRRPSDPEPPLRTVADLATITSRSAVESLVRAWLRFQRRDDDPREQRRIAREAKRVWEPYALAAMKAARADPGLVDMKDTDIPWSRPFRVQPEAARERMEEEMERPLERWPETLSFLFGPELVYPAAVPVARARFFFDPERSRWFPMHELRLRMGQGHLPLEAK